MKKKIGYIRLYTVAQVQCVACMHIISDFVMDYWFLCLFSGKKPQIELLDQPNWRGTNTANVFLLKTCSKEENFFLVTIKLSSLQHGFSHKLNYVELCGLTQNIRKKLVGEMLYQPQSLMVPHWELKKIHKQQQKLRVLIKSSSDIITAFGKRALMSFHFILIWLKFSSYLSEVSKNKECTYRFCELT